MRPLPEAPTTPGSPTTWNPIIFFDGECGLCHRFVRFVIRHDRARVFHFAPLNGPTFEAFRPRLPDPQLDSLILLDEAGLHDRSTAVLRVLRRIGGAWGLLALPVAVTPPTLRDRLYDLLAKARYRAFGRADYCALPRPTERNRFLP